MNTATFFLSTGRCGTQWLASNLQEIQDESFVISHEPLHNRYFPRLMLSTNDPMQTGNAEEIIGHCEKIEEILKEKSYIECGWPVWGAIPYLLQRFKGRIKIVHLIRNPISVACSWVSHGAFCPPLIEGMPFFKEKILASPYDEGTSFPQYRDKWNDMNPFEKSLFFWAEVNALGLKIEKFNSSEWRRIYFEDLFQGKGLSQLITFLGITEPLTLKEKLNKTQDEFQYVCNTWWYPKDIQKHQEILKLAEFLGYSPLDINEEKLRKRYLEGVPNQN